MSSWSKRDNWSVPLRGKSRIELGRMKQKEEKADDKVTIPKRNAIEMAAIIESPAPDNDASVRSFGIFLKTQENIVFIKII